jgi:hypothetical protein
MSLVPYIDRHAGQTAWIFGKGPSLQFFDFSSAGKLRFAINDVIAHIPDCQYGFANDGVARWRDAYRPGQTLFQPLRAMQEFDSRNGAVDCEVVTYEDTHNQHILSSRVDDHAQSLCIRPGTLGSALQIMRIMGIRTIHLVGFDGGGQHAGGFAWRTRLRADHARDYDQIKAAAIISAQIMGLTLTFHNEPTMDHPETKTVQFTRSVFAEGKPYSVGEIARFSTKIAAELIVAGAAVYAKPIQATYIATTPAPVPTAPAPAPVEPVKTKRKK